MVKLAVGSLAGAGAALIMNGVITEHTRPRSFKQRCSVIAARVVLSALVAETTKRQSDKVVDETFQTVINSREYWASLKKAISGEETPEPPSPASGTADN